MILNKKIRLISKIACVFFTCYVIVYSSPSIGQQTKDSLDSKMFIIVNVESDDKLSVRNYTLQPEVTPVDLSDIIITKDARDYLEVGKIFRGEGIPDIKLILLQKGYATLKIEKMHSKVYVEAQKEAEKSQAGIWKPSPSPTPVSTSTVIPEPQEVNWGQIFSWLGNLAITVTGLYGGSSLLQLFNTWKRRNKISLILVGRPSTGKSWLWSRLLHPDISEGELLKIGRNANTIEQKANQVKPMGRYEIIPVYTDTPGMGAGQQVDAFFKATKVNNGLDRLLKPNKSVWIVMLSTTPDSRVTFSSSENLKIDQSYIDQQLGQLELYVGIMNSKNTPNPSMVILCISKFDLFSDSPPNTDKNSEDMQVMLDDTFAKHTDVIKNACKNQIIPFEKVFCSASKKDWGSDKILGYIERALFKK